MAIYRVVITDSGTTSKVEYSGHTEVDHHKVYLWCGDLIDCNCSPTINYSSSTVATLIVGELSGCNFTQYVIDWYKSGTTDHVLTTGKNQALDSSIEVAHPVNYPMPPGEYTGKLQYIKLNGSSQKIYPTVDRPPCEMYCTDLTVQLAVIDISPVQCGTRNLPEGNDYDYSMSYNVANDYKQYSDYEIELADGNVSSYLAIYFSASSVPDQVKIFFGDTNGTLIAWYESGSQITSSSEPSLPSTRGYLAGDGRKFVIDLDPYKPYSDGQIVTVRVISSTNINTSWTIYSKCLPTTAFPETTNYFPTSLRDNNDITNINATRTPDCLYTLTFTLPSSIVSSGLSLSNFYKYNTITTYNDNQFNYSTGAVTVTFNKQHLLWSGGRWGCSSQYGYQIDVPGVSTIDCNTDYTADCKGFHYKWDPVTKSLKITENSSITNNSTEYYGLKSKWQWIIGEFKIGSGNYTTGPWSSNEDDFQHYYSYRIDWKDSIFASSGYDAPCGDSGDTYRSWSFNFSAIVKIMGVTIDPTDDNDIDPNTGQITSTKATQITNAEKIGGVEQQKTFEFFANDPGGQSYTTTTTTLDQYGNGSCDTRNSDLWDIIHSSTFTGNQRALYNCEGDFANVIEGRSICTNYCFIQMLFIKDVNNNETVKYLTPFYAMNLKSLADTTCTALEGWQNNTSGPSNGTSNNPAWEYWYYIAYIKITLTNQYVFVIEDWLNHTTGAIAESGSIIYQATTTTTTTAPTTTTTTQP